MKIEFKNIKSRNNFIPPLPLDKSVFKQNNQFLNKQLDRKNKRKKMMQIFGRKPLDLFYIFNSVSEKVILVTFCCGKSWSTLFDIGRLR